jgi:HD-like signal output (HDOD) protein/AmiR/NasT family two-component response regulator
MSAGKHHALIIERDATIQHFIATALAEQGIDCATSVSATEAIARLKHPDVDAVLVDLAMRNPEGRPFALDLLKLSPRPLVVVQTDVIEPQLAQELIARGVDDVLVKPIDFGALASRVKALLDSRAALRSLAGGQAVPKAVAPEVISADTLQESRVTMAELNEKLAEVSRVLPISAAALDVYEMTKSLDWDLSQIAAAVQRDAALATEVLRMANSAYYNPPGRPIVDMDEAVMRIGQKRVGELALSINALSAVTPTMIPWMDLDLTWNRSMASGIALELLVDLGRHEEVSDGLFVSAIMHPLGRIVLGMLFPDKYLSLLSDRAETKGTLQELERKVFPASHADVMAQLLANWKLAPEVFLPLKFSLDSYASISRLLEPMRTKAELVKVAILLGRLAVGHWENWDSVEFPPPSVLDRLKCHEVGPLVTQTRADVALLAEFRAGGKPSGRKTVRLTSKTPIAYSNCSGHDADFLREFLSALDLDPQTTSLFGPRPEGQPILANCLGTCATQFAAGTFGAQTFAFVDQAKCAAFEQWGPAIGMPNSFERVGGKVLAHLAECGLATAANHA